MKQNMDSAAICLRAGAECSRSWLQVNCDSYHIYTQLQSNARFHHHPTQIQSTNTPQLYRWSQQKHTAAPQKRQTDLVSSVQLFLSFDQLLLLVGEVDKLVQSFLVHVAVALELHVTLLQLLEQLHTQNPHPLGHIRSPWHSFSNMVRSHSQFSSKTLLYILKSYIKWNFYFRHTGSD